MRAKILIIEDEEAVRENIAEILAIADYEVIEAADGLSGIKAAEEGLPDLIICDVMMPHLDGYGTLKIINSKEHLMHIPFMFLTAKAQQEDFREGMKLGADDYITKPFKSTDLLQSIEVRLEKSKRFLKIDNTDEGIKHFYSEAKALKEFEELSKDGEVRNYRAKEHIFHEGDIPRHIYFVLSGRVKDVHVNELGKELTTKIYGPGEFFGYLALLGDHSYDKSAITLEDATLRKIPKEDLDLLLFNNRDFAHKFIRMLANQTLGLEGQLISLVYGSVRKKVADALIELSNSQKGKIIKITREEIANMIGATRESVGRALSSLKDDGMLKLEDHIEILDKDRLSSINN